MRPSFFLSFSQPVLQSRRRQAEQAFQGHHYGYYAYLLVRGVGFRVWPRAGWLYFDIGYTHYFALRLPVSVRAVTRKVKLVLLGPQPQILYDLAYRIRRLRFPDPYKGKGIRPFHHSLRLKVGKVKG